ncbi:MAG: amino acid adenylation domain-containing protein, partial [Roseiflexaceae bacterium]
MSLSNNILELTTESNIQTYFSQEKCVHALFERQVEKCADAIAVTQEEQGVTYHELNAKANQLAHSLRELGVGPDRRVAVCMERGVDVVIALLAALKAGGAYVPLDPAYPAERLAFMLDDSAPVVLLTHGPAREALRGIRITVPTLDLDGDQLPWLSQNGHNLERSCVGVDATSLAYVVYTSGSTGLPKGVMVEHRNLVNLIDWHHKTFDLKASDCCSCVAGLGFDASACEIWPTLCAGARLLMPSVAAARNPELLIEWWQEQPLAVSALPTSLAEFAFARGINHKSLRALLTGGDRIQRSAPAWAKFRVINNYGPTETTVLATSGCLAPSDEQIHIGAPIGNTQIYILDESLQLAPVGVAGELYIGGAGVARGYLKRPELTAERFQSDPHGPAGARMYKTGDLGRWLPNGNIEFLGRNDFQVKIRGYRIELGEIEAALASHRQVRESVVLAHQDAAGDKRLVAYYTGQAIAAETLRAHVSAALPDYMVPSAYVHLEALPLTANGKLDRRALPVPGEQAYVTRQYEPPANETERRLAHIWGEALNCEWVGRNDNFFELGGHSFLGVRVIDRMRSEGLATDVHTLFTARTLGELAEAVASRAKDHFAIPANGILPESRIITPEMLPIIELTQAEIDRIVAGVPGGAANVQDIYPLAPLQEGILFHHLMSAQGDVYSSQTLLAFPTRKLLDLFVEALRAIIARHDILRTAVVWEGLPEAVQVVRREAPLKLEEAALDPSRGEAGAQLRARFDPRCIRLDIRVAPLMRCIAAQDSTNGRWLMLWLTHHMVIDHATVKLIALEAQAKLLGNVDCLPEPVPFRNFVAQTRLGTGNNHEAFFRQMLGDIDEPTAPFGLVEAQGDGSSIEEARIELNTVLADRLHERARALGVSVASLCHLGWALVLGRISGRDDIVFGTVLLGRMQSGPGAEEALGLFINTLPIRIRVGTENVENGVRQTHAQLADLMTHEHASLAVAQRCSRVAAPMPLFSSLLNYQHTPRGIGRSLENVLSSVGIELLGSEERTNYPITLSVDDFGDGFLLTAQAVHPVGSARICEFMQTALEGLVEALEQKPKADTRAIKVLPETERRKLLHEWNATHADYPQEKCVHELFERQVEKSPDPIAVTQEEESVSYGELNARANQLAHALRELGVGPDRRVAVCMERGVDVVIALLATLKAGGAYMPLDPAYPAERLAYLLEDSGPVVLLTHGPAREALRGITTIVPMLDLDRAQLPWSSQNGDNLERARVGVDATSLAYVIYTSGSTGLPKGIMVEHRNLVNFIAWHSKTFRLRPGDGCSCVVGLGFDASACEIWPTLCAGAGLLMPSAATARNSELLMEWWRQQPIAVSVLPTPMAEFVFARGIDNKSLRALITGGDRVQQLAPSWAKFVVTNNYGPTETTVVATSGCLTSSDERIHIGAPISNTQIYILDESLQLAPVGVTGELYIGGAGVARGYLNRPELTAERFQSDPFGPPGARMYKAGDLGRWLPDGTIEFLGRNDFQVKIRGYRIELGEVEAALASHPQVRESVVIAHQDGAGSDKRLVAYYTGQAIAAETLRAHTSARLPEYMVPSAYVYLEAVPLTANGKVDRRALPAPGEQAYVTRQYEPPGNNIEMRLARIWAELLRVERVGRHDNFFELGGHSLLAVALIERMRREGLTLDVRTLFASPTLQALAEAVAGETDAPVAIPSNRILPESQMITPEMLPLVELAQAEIDRIVAGVPGGAVNVQDIYPLAPLQEGILFHHLMSAEGDAYLLQALLAFDTRARLDGFLEALRAVIARHDILRTAVMWEGLAEPVQVVWREAPLRVEEIALDSCVADAEAELRERFDPRRMCLDVRQAPLVRCIMAEDVKRGRWLLLWLSHHLAIDHVTLEHIVAEVQAYLQAETDRLPEPLPFRNFVAQARLGMAKEQHEAFFRAMLGDVDEPTAPFGFMEAQGDGSGLEQVRIELDRLLAEQLGQRARALGVSVASLCHFAWALVLARVSGREDVVFGTVLLGRMQSGMGAEGALGLFINTLPVRIRVGAESVERSVRQTHALLTELMRHEHVSLALAQRCSRVAAPAPLFTALLNYRHTPQDTAQSLDGTLAGIEILSAQERTNYPLSLSVDDLGTGFALTAQAVPPIAPGRICELMRTALEGLVQALNNVPETEARAIDVLPEAERRQVLEQWNATESAYPTETCIHELFERQAEQRPDGIALVQDDNSLSYGELNARANRLAHYLRRRGVEPDTRVAICMQRSFELVIALLATLKAGGAYVPLDPAYPAERLAFMLNDSAPAVLLADDATAETVGAHSEGTPVLNVDRNAHRWASESELNPKAIRQHPRALAYVIYTSGSTGRPKGVMIE